MKHYIPLQSAHLWTESEPETQPTKIVGSAFRMTAAVLLMLVPITLAYVAWNPTSPFHYDLQQWFETVKISIGL